MVAPISFDYDRAFSRNIGWVTLVEQSKLKKARIAIKAKIRTTIQRGGSTPAKALVKRLNMAFHQMSTKAGAAASLLPGDRIA